MALRINPEDPTVRGITRPLLRLDGGSRSPTRSNG